MISIRRAGYLLALAALAACSDDLPFQAPTPSAAKPRAVVHPQQPSWRGYWHTEGELFVYDTRPQFGLNSSYHSGYMDQIAGTNARLVRSALYWNVETQHPSYLAHTDAEARDRGMEMVFVLDEWPGAFDMTGRDSTWRRTYIYEPFKNHIIGLMRKPGYNKVRYWQLGNEPDAGCDAGAPYNGYAYTSGGTRNSTHFDPDRYAQGWNYADMLKHVYPAMKLEARMQGREIVVISAGLTGEEEIRTFPRPDGSTGCLAKSASVSTSDPHWGNESWNFLSGMYANGAKAYFDVLAIHTYGTTATSRNSMSTSANHVYSLLHTSLNDANRPLWITELGASAVSTAELLKADGPGNDAQQADDLQRDWYADALNIQSGYGQTPVIMGYTLRTDYEGHADGTGLNPQTVSPWDYSFGLVRENGNPRPSYTHLNSFAPARLSATQMGSFRVGVYGRVPASHMFDYDGNDFVVVDGIAVTAPAPAPVEFIIPTVFNVFQGSSWSPAGYNAMERGNVGGGAVKGFRATKGQLPDGVSVCYSIVFSPTGAWEPDQCDGAAVGGPGETRTAQAIRMTIQDPQGRGWSVCYSAHIAGTGWVYPEQCNGSNAGWVGATIDAVRVRFVRSHL